MAWSYYQLLTAIQKYISTVSYSVILGEIQASDVLNCDKVGLISYQSWARLKEHSIIKSGRRNHIWVFFLRVSNSKHENKNYIYMYINRRFPDLKNECTQILETWKVPAKTDLSKSIPRQIPFIKMKTTNRDTILWTAELKERLGTKRHL